MQYLKRKHFSHRIQFHTEKVWFIWKKLKKITFLFFLSKFFLTWCLQLQIFQICAKKFKNWVPLCFWNVLKLKVTKGELDISIRLEMAEAYQLLASGPVLQALEFALSVLELNKYLLISFFNSLILQSFDSFKLFYSFL